MFQGFLSNLITVMILRVDIYYYEKKTTKIKEKRSNNISISIYKSHLYNLERM